MDTPVIFLIFDIKSLINNYINAAYLSSPEALTTIASLQNPNYKTFLYWIKKIINATITDYSILNNRILINN